MSPIQAVPERTSAQYLKRVAPTSTSAPGPTNPTYLFLDHSDPDRSTVVRRKAREWVNKSKEDAEKSKERFRKGAKTQIRQVQRKGLYTRQKSGSVPRTLLELQTFDAFGILPRAQKDCYHIIQFCKSHLHTRLYVWKSATESTC